MGRTQFLLGACDENDDLYVGLLPMLTLGRLGQAVYDRRSALGISQSELARRANMTQPQISNLELGGTVPTLPLLARLAKALHAA